ncbi:MAG: histidinol-phosphatase [Proteobacteria bacterium]|nr:histidinol-phosphatase [Pseudomonadota bacterium]
MNQENSNISCKIDYHIHTMLCNHAKYGMEAYIKKAVLSGFDEICFLDHLTISEPGNRQSMAPSEVPFYFQSVQNLKIRYREVISIKAGLETDYHPDHIDLINKIIETFSFDVIGSSLHFPKGVDVVSYESDWSKGGLETNEIYRLYFEYLDKMLDNNYFDFICHIDLMKKFGRDLPDCFEKELDEIIKKIAKNNIAVEVNTSGYDHTAQNAYPSIDILKKCCKYGVGITIGSDAHEPDNIGRHYEKVLPLIRSAGYKQVCVFTERKRSFIEISAK